MTRTAAPTLLIVNADDFGLSNGVNEGIVRAHTHGIVSSTSLMVRAPAAEAAADLVRDHRALGVGLHIDLGEWEFVDDKWRALYLRAPLDDADRLRIEIAAQLDLFRELTGHEPTHLDSHQHVHGREPIASLVRQIGAALRVPVRHHPQHARYCGDFYGQDAEGNPFPDRVSAGFLSQLLDRIEPGVTELCCHPAAWIDFESCYALERLSELKALCDISVRAAVDERSIEILSFQELAV